MSKGKVHVRICVGTVCFVQGGSDLLLYSDFVDPEVLDMCEIEGASCLGGCKRDGSGAPYVEIDGVLHSKVTQEEFKRLLSEAVANA